MPVRRCFRGAVVQRPAIIDIDSRGFEVGALIIRDLDDDVKKRLRMRAAEHGRSMESEARAILTSTVGAGRPAKKLGSSIRDQFAGLEEPGLVVPERTGVAGTVDFDS